MFGSSGPKSSANATCWSELRSWAGKTSTEYFQNASLTALSSSRESGILRSRSPISAAKPDVIGKMLIVMSSLRGDADGSHQARPFGEVFPDVSREVFRRAAGERLGAARL